MKRVLNYFLIGAIFISCAASAHPQLQDEEDFQSWNDIQITVPINKVLDFQTQGTFRFGRNISRLNEGRFAGGFVWKPHRSFSVNPFYWYISARNANSQFRMEHRLHLRFVYGFPFKKIGLSHRSTFELRRRRPANTWRYRPSLTVEKDIPEKVIPKAKFFMTDEIFYDSGLNRFSRNRFSIGISKTLTTKLSLDIYYLRQNDGFSRPGELHVIGTSWKIRL